MREAKTITLLLFKLFFSKRPSRHNLETDELGNLKKGERFLPKVDTEPLFFTIQHKMESSFGGTPAILTDPSSILELPNRGIREHYLIVQICRSTGFRALKR